MARRWGGLSSFLLTRGASLMGDGSVITFGTWLVQSCWLRKLYISTIGGYPQVYHLLDYPLIQF
jgi:hypothetical protein